MRAVSFRAFALKGLFSPKKVADFSDKAKRGKIDRDFIYIISHLLNIMEEKKNIVLFNHL